MAIQDLGESLLSDRREKLASRERQREEQQKKIERRQMFKTAGALIGSAFQTNAQKKALSFLQQEPIMAARAKYNSGVANSISILKQNDEALAHQEGIEGYLRDKYITLLDKQLRLDINEQEYTKDGFDNYVREIATEQAKKNKTLFQNAVDAAMQVGQDNTAFDKFIKINDGISDTASGATAQGITGFFRGKSKESLRQDAADRIINSRYIKNVEALTAARSALSRGLSVKDALAEAGSIERYKMSDTDYTVVSEEAGTRNIKQGTRERTVTGKYVTTKNSWGQTRKRFEPDDPTARSIENIPEVTKRQVTRGGLVYSETIKQYYDNMGNPTGTPIITQEPLNMVDSEGSKSITAAEAAQVGRDIFQNGSTFKGAKGGTGAIEDINTAYTMYIFGTDDVDMTDDISKQRFDTSNRTIAYDSAKINASTRAEQFTGNSSRLSDIISQHIIFNDIARITGATGIAPSWVPFIGSDVEIQWENSLRLKSGDVTPLEILEALGSINNSGHGNIDTRYINSIINSKALMDQISNFESDPELLARYRQVFNAYEGNSNYNHLFQDRKKLGTDGETVSVMDLLNIASDRLATRNQ